MDITSILAVDSGNLSVLTLLDLSAAFDTVDHGILLQRLQKSYGIEGFALDLFRSYLTDRVQHVRRRLSSSETKVVRFGLPQGSVLGPLILLLSNSFLFGVA